jgi:8-oxo-dGTP diphosphatase
VPASDFHLVSWLIARRSDGHVLLGRRTGSYGTGLWGLPGGHVEDHETLAEAAARETLEEVGLSADSAHLRALGLSRYVDGDVRGADFFFLATDWQGEAAPLSECSEVAWLDPFALPPDVLPWLPGLLQHVLQRETDGQDWLTETLG